MSLIDDLKRHEGFRATPYRCTANRLTIGYGTNIDEGITEEQAELLLISKVKDIIDDLEGLSCWGKLTQTRRNVLTNMAYNLGVDGLLGFKKMFEAIAIDDYQLAAYEMLSSKWRWQVGNRATELADKMRAG